MRVQVDKTITLTVHINELQEQFSKATELEIKNGMSEFICILYQIAI